MHPPGAVGAVVLPGPCVTHGKIPFKAAVLPRVGGCKMVKQYHLQGKGEVAVGAGGQDHPHRSLSWLWWAPAGTAAFAHPKTDQREGRLKTKQKQGQSSL